MTNSLNIPVEAFEASYPVRVHRGSGGNGRFRGGDGIVRELKFLADGRGSILSERRSIAPHGLFGWKEGKVGRNELVLPNGWKRRLVGKETFTALKDSILRVKTPGGAGWGKPEH